MGDAREAWSSFLCRIPSRGARSTEDRPNMAICERGKEKAGERERVKETIGSDEAWAFA